MEYSVTGVPSVVTATGTALVAPTSVKVLPSGALVVADSMVGFVLINNGVASVFSTGSITLQSTQGLSLDFAGNIYVADPVGGQVVELNLTLQLRLPSLTLSSRTPAAATPVRKGATSTTMATPP